MLIQPSQEPIFTSSQRGANPNRPQNHQITNDVTPEMGVRGYFGQPPGLKHGAQQLIENSRDNDGHSM